MAYYKRFYAIPAKKGRLYGGLTYSIIKMHKNMLYFGRQLTKRFMITINIDRLSKYFVQGTKKTRILENATFTFNSEQTVAITGVSGSGKSTLLQLIAGLDVPTAGTVYFNGTNIHQLDALAKKDFLQKTIGFIFQSPYLIDGLSVRENVMLKGLIAREPYAQAAKRAEELLENIGLTHKASCAVRTLSGGEQQRVALARALFMRPAFIIADEPTAHLDASTKHTIIDLLLTARKQFGTGLIIATHDVSVAGSMDGVTRLENGQLHEVIMSQFPADVQLDLC